MDSLERTIRGISSFGKLARCDYVKNDLSPLREKAPMQLKD